MIQSRIYQIAFITYCLLLQCIPLKSQDTTALLQQLKEAKRDTLKASLYAKLAGKYYYSNPQRSLEFAQEGIKFAASRNAEKYLPELYYAAGTANNLLGNDEGALASLKSADSVATRTNNIDIQVNSLRTSGYIFMTQSNYDQAGKLLFRALEIAQENKNEGLAAIVYSTISSLYINQANYDKAIFYGEKGLQYFRHSGNPQQLGSNALNLGLVYAEQKDYKKAQLLYDEALAAYTRVDFKLGIATVYGNISNIIVNDKPRQIAYLLKAKSIWDSISPDHPNAIGNTGNLGLAYLSLVTDTTVRVLKDSLIPATRAERLEKAERYLLYAVEMCKKLDFGRDLAYFTSSLAELEEVKGDYKLANTYLHEYIRLNDTLFSQDNKNKLAEKESKYVIDRKNAELEINKLIKTLLANDGQYIGVTATPARLNLNNTFENDSALWVDFAPHSKYVGQDFFFPSNGKVDYKLKVFEAGQGSEKQELQSAILHFMCGVAEQHERDNKNNFTMLVHTSGKKVEHQEDVNIIRSTIATLANPNHSGFKSLKNRLVKIAAEYAVSNNATQIYNFVLQNINRNMILEINSRSSSG
ncbi:MAG: tetratricopeptide repeat protein, partial [Pedobacter sp.]